MSEIDKAAERLGAESFGLCSTLLRTFSIFYGVGIVLGLPLDLIFKAEAALQKLVTHLTILFCLVMAL